MQLITTKDGCKATLRLGGTGKNHGGILLMSITKKTYPALIDILAQDRAASELRNKDVMLLMMCFVSLVCLVALFGFVRPARMTFRGGEEFKPLAIAAVTVGVQGEADWHVGFMGSARAGRKAAEESFHSIDILAIVPDALSQDETRLLVSASPSCLGHPSCHSKVENSFGSSELLKGCCEEAESLKLYASQLVLVLDGNVMLLGAFDELVDLQNSLLGTNGYGANLPNSAARTRSQCISFPSILAVSWQF